MEFLGGVDGVLAGHGVHDQDGLVGRDRLFHVLQFRHEVVVDVQPAAGVNDGPGVRQIGSAPDAGGGDFGGGGRLGVFGVHRDVQLLAEGFQLGYGGGPAEVGGNQHGAVALALHVERELGGGSGFAGTL